MDLSFYQYLFLIICCIAFYLWGVLASNNKWGKEVNKLKEQRDYLTKLNDTDRETYRKNLLKAYDRNRELKNESLVLKEQLHQEKEWFKVLEGRTERV